MRASALRSGFCAIVEGRRSRRPPSERHLGDDRRERRSDATAREELQLKFIFAGGKAVFVRRRTMQALPPARVAGFSLRWLGMAHAAPAAARTASAGTVVKRTISEWGTRVRPAIRRSFSSPVLANS